MAYRTSLPLHPTEGNGQKKNKGKVKGGRPMGILKNRSKDKYSDEEIVYKGTSVATGEDTIYSVREDSFRNRIQRRQALIRKKLGIKPNTGIKGTIAPTPLTQRHNKPQ